MAEYRRQLEGIELIPSENYVSAAVLNAISSVFTNKYSEGYRQALLRGNEHVDVVKILPLTGLESI
jgi:glycine hydroxymethyltransferase